MLVDFKPMNSRFHFGSVIIALPPFQTSSRPQALRKLSQRLVATRYALEHVAIRCYMPYNLVNAFAEPVVFGHSLQSAEVTLAA